MRDVLVMTTAGGQAILSETTIVAFSSHMLGQALRRGDDGYERARMVWNGMVDKRPALIVRCAGVADVVDAEKIGATSRAGAALFAMEQGLYLVAPAEISTV